MKKFLAILIGFALAAGTAEARTLYVDASRPNNNGNGLKPATAKQTIQAAINIAKAGDTILVYPGWYSPIKTNNKKIVLKSVQGASKTGITGKDCVLAVLGRGNSFSSKGKNTTMKGFLLDGQYNNRDPYPYDDITWGVSGGLLAACCFQRIFCSGFPGGLACNATLTRCVFRNNRAPNIENCILDRCMIVGNEGGWNSQIKKSRLCNCLVMGNEGWGYTYTYENKQYNHPPLFESSVFVNCTIARNCTLHSPCKTYPSGIAVTGPLFSKTSKFFNCILRNNYHRTRTKQNGRYVYGRIVIHNADTANRFANTYYQTFTDNRDPKFVHVAKGNYKLKRGSPCIDTGKLNAKLKKLAGTKDLAGKKRIRGKTIDRGCYEY